MRRNRKAHCFYLQTLLLIVACVFVSACGIQINDGLVDEVINSDSTPGSVEAPSPNMITIDQTDDDNTATGFGGATHNGTNYASPVLTLSATKNYAELDESWTPKWSNLIGYWKLNETSWTGAADEVIDSSGNGNHGMSSGAANTTTNSRIGDYAGTFDTNDNGSGDFITISNESSLRPGQTSISISVWAYIPNANIRSIILGKRENGGDYEQYEIAVLGNVTGTTSGKKIVLTHRESTSSLRTFISTNNYGRDEWVHIVMVSDMVADSLTCYVNGASVPGTYNSVGAWPTVNNPDNLQIGSANFNSYAWNNKLDDVAIWYHTALTAEEVALIYSRQSAKFSGEMKSRIMDSRDINSSWTSLDWITTLPFGKEITGSNGSESSSDYSSLVGSTGSTNDNDLMSSLLFLTHLNEASGTSGAGSVNESSNYAAAVDGTPNGGTTFGNNGMFDKSAYFDGVDDEIVFNDFDITGDLTISAWVRPTSYGTNRRIVAKWGSSSAVRSYLLSTDDSTSSEFTFAVEGSSGIDICDSDSANRYNIGQWYHVVGVFDIGTDSCKIYVNGVDRTDVELNQTTAGIQDTSVNLKIGNDNNGQYFHGYIDEVVMWNRALTSAEVLQLYRRGANRIKYQIRSCASADCSDQDALTGDGWKGPGGNYFTYFSELQNNNSITSACGTAQECFSNELSINGSVNTSSPSIPFNDYGTDGLLEVDNNQYFQYRVIMESDDENTACDSGTATCMPELKSVTVGPGHSYEEE